MHSMVFDVHIHVQPWEMVKPEVLELMDGASIEGIREILESPDRLLEHMDSEGIERACLINYVSPDVMGFTSKVNDWIARYTQSHRDRLLPVGSVHPEKTADVDAEITRVLDLGIRMIKIHPPHQRISPNAYRSSCPQQAAIYARCQERGVPVMFHTGTSIFPGARNVFADPMPVDDVAIDFPDLKIILAHAGRPLYGDTAVFLARRHANVHLDLSGIPPRALSRYVPEWDRIAHKLLWGTDWPSPGVRSMRANVDAFREVAANAKIEAMILRENAENLFGFSR